MKLGAKLRNRTTNLGGDGSEVCHSATEGFIIGVSINTLELPWPFRVLQHIKPYSSTCVTRPHGSKPQGDIPAIGGICLPSNTGPLCFCMDANHRDLKGLSISNKPTPTPRNKLLLYLFSVQSSVF